MGVVSVECLDQLGKACFRYFARGTGSALAYCPCQAEPGSGCARHHPCSEDEGNNQNKGKDESITSIGVSKFCVE